MGNTHLSEQERLQQLRVTLVHEGREPLLQGSEGLQQLRATPVARALCFAAGVVTRLLGPSSKAPTANVWLALFVELEYTNRPSVLQSSTVIHDVNVECKVA